MKCNDDREDHIPCDICGRLVSRERIRNREGIRYCQKHYKQLLLYGTTLDSNPRTCNDPNDIRVVGSDVFIGIYNKKSELIATAINSDLEDLEKIDGVKWHLNSAGYVYSSRTMFMGRRGVLLHSLIMNSNQIVDHINHNVLDNRKCNLRFATNAQNLMNRRSKGVSLVKKTGKYYACISINGRTINLGSFYSNIKEATYARWYAEIILFGDFRYPRDEPSIDESQKSEIRDYVYKKLVRYCTNIIRKEV